MYQYSLKFFTIFFIILKSSYTYQELCSVTYSEQTCESPTNWQNLEGDSLSCDKCPLADWGQSYFITNDNSRQGYVYDCKVNPQVEIKDYSTIGVEILYLLKEEKGKVSFSINGFVPIIEIINHVPAIISEYGALYCPERRDFFRATFKIPQNKKQNALNDIKFYVIKESIKQFVGIKRIKVWTNCTQNCNICKDSINCQECFKGFHMIQLSTGEIVCEQALTCTIENCFSCYKGNTLELCSKCKEGYLLSNDRLKCDKTTSCPGDEIEINSVCTAYTPKCMLIKNNEDKLDQNSIIFCPYDFELSKLRCKKNIVFYPYENYSTIQCNCFDFNCTDCNEPCTNCESLYLPDQTNVCSKPCPFNQYNVGNTLNCQNCPNKCLDCDNQKCLMCQEGYVVDQTYQQCVQKCRAGFYFEGSNCVQYRDENCLIASSKSNCTQCKKGYIFNQQTQKCKKDCGQELDKQCEDQIWLKLKVSDQIILDNGYKLIVSFNRDIIVDGIDLEFFIKFEILNFTNFSYKIQDLTSKQFAIQVTSQYPIKDKKIKITMLDEVFLIKYIVLERSIEEDFKTKTITPEEKEKEQKKSRDQIAEIGQKVSTVAVSSIIPIVVLSDFYILINTIDITGFLYYTLFLNIRHPDNLVQFYECFRNFQFPFIPNIFDRLIDADYVQQSPPKFMQNNTDSNFKYENYFHIIWVIQFLSSAIQTMQNYQQQML